MPRPPTPIRIMACAATMLVAAQVYADKNVAVRALAEIDYTTQKFGSDGPRQETYVFMQGNYYPGATVDRSIARMPFRRLAEMLARDLARQRYVPAKELNSSDLLIVVHWGTTVPYISTMELMAKSTTVTDGSTTSAGLTRVNAAEVERSLNNDEAPPSLGDDLGGTSDDLDRQLEFDSLELMSGQLSTEMALKTNVQLLGYSDELRKARGSLTTSQKERTLRYDVSTERYFIIMRAYDLRILKAGGRIEKPAWVVYLNVASPGSNFNTAVVKMGNVGVDFFGRNVDEVSTVRPTLREGTVTIEPAIILGTEE